MPAPSTAEEGYVEEIGNDGLKKNLCFTFCDACQQFHMLKLSTCPDCLSLNSNLSSDEENAKFLYLYIVYQGRI